MASRLIAGSPENKSLSLSFYTAVDKLFMQLTRNLDFHVNYSGGVSLPPFKQTFLTHLHASGHQVFKITDGFAHTAPLYLSKESCGYFVFLAIHACEILSYTLTNQHERKRRCNGTPIISTRNPITQLLMLNLQDAGAFSSSLYRCVKLQNVFCIFSWQLKEWCFYEVYQHIVQ